MGFVNLWIDNTVHCTSVSSLSSNPESITNGVAATFVAQVKSSEAITSVTIDPGDGSGAAATTAGTAANGLTPYTLTTAHTYTGAASYPQTYEVKVAVTTASGVTTQEFAVSVA